MQPAFNRLRSHRQTGLVQAPAVNNDAGSPGEHGTSLPELLKPCPGCPAGINPAVFQRFIEQGEAPGDLADVARLAIWCMRNEESKALTHLFRQAGIDDVCLNWWLGHDKEVGVLLHAVANHNALTILSLAGIKLSSARMGEICQALQHDASLTSLDVSWNTIDCDGAKAIVAMLAVNTSLTELNLKASDLDDECGIVLAHALTVNTTLAGLNLNCNFLGPVAADAILAALEVNKALTSLDLGGNELQHGNAKATDQMLRKNSTLTMLNLSGNKIGITDKYRRAEAVRHIVDGFECNTVLMTLALERNNLDAFIGISAPDCLEGRLHDLHERNRSLASLSKQDAAIYAQPGLPISLPSDAGELLSRFLILVSSSMYSYRHTMVDVQCALNALAGTAAVARPGWTAATTNDSSGGRDSTPEPYPGFYKWV